ncbi:DUF4843 domain-containing protein [Chitinophaga parva]|nr:DUF4843 domain-containing protein [Chitinophaga parva]
MKRSCNILLLTVCVLLAASCKKESLMTYHAADNIYFNYSYQTNSGPLFYADSLNVTFAFSPDKQTDSILRIPVAVTGTAKGTDRNFDVAVDAGATATAGTDYILPATFVMHAGRITDTIPVTLKRTATLKTSVLSFTLRLRENDQFKTQIEYRSRNANDLSYVAAGDTSHTLTFKVLVSDQLQAGPYWSNYSYYFGDFSEKKVRLMNQVAGMPLDFWSVELSTTQQRANALYYGGFTYRYLTDHAAAGNTIFEADGQTPMTMGSYFQQ